jgi:hypothetical protein
MGWLCNRPSGLRGVYWLATPPKYLEGALGVWGLWGKAEPRHNAQALRLPLGSDPETVGRLVQAGPAAVGGSGKAWPGGGGWSAPGTYILCG